MPDRQPRVDKPQSRRSFIKGSSLLVAGGTVAGTLTIARAAHPYGSDVIRVGLVGCGRRGTASAAHALSTQGPTKLVAVGDVFSYQIAKCLRGLSRHRRRLCVPPQNQFVGWDAYLQVLNTDIDLVLLATPPGFRPLHFEASIRAGKHVFMEKPVAVDAPGVRRVLAANEAAKKKRLSVSVGLQRRHEPRYRETIRRLQDGAIGDIMLARVYWNGAAAPMTPRVARQTELEHQLANWCHFTWLSGDHIVEQHIHNLDVMNWLHDAYPVMANGHGGPKDRTQEGRIYDHHFVEFTYANGSMMFSQCRQNKNCWNSVSEHVHGTEGRANISNASIHDQEGNNLWRYGRGGGGGHQEEHHDLFANLRAGRVSEEGEYGAMSTMTAILGRMATYSGSPVTMEDALNSDQVIEPALEHTS